MIIEILFSLLAVAVFYKLKKLLKVLCLKESKQMMLMIDEYLKLENSNYL